MQAPGSTVDPPCHAPMPGSSARGQAVARCEALPDRRDSSARVAA
jgi:hypothetical protein